MYAMGLYPLEDNIRVEFSKVRSRYFWMKEKDKQKYGMILRGYKWSPNESGGLGILDISSVS